jgi:ssDNA thymidine ADP-ribosyltransferase, DarT
MNAPARPKIYHILHVDRLASVLADGSLWSDAMVQRKKTPGTTIGMNDIKKRRLLTFLSSHSGLKVGQCVPFYFCPRSVMLYLISCRNHGELEYQEGQEPILHLECDLHACIEWANTAKRRWAFTLSNAGSRYFEDRADISQLSEINWAAVSTTRWGGRNVDSSIKEGKQAEFLLEESFPWRLVERIGVQSNSLYTQVSTLLNGQQHKPKLEILPEWYY